MVLILCLLLPCAYSLTWLSPGPFAGVTTPTYEWQGMWQAENPAVWGKNYTIAISPDVFGCGLAPFPPGYGAGKILTSLGPPSDMCVPFQMAEVAKANGGVAVLLCTPFSQIFSMYHTWGPTPWSYGQGFLPPLVTWGNINPQLPVAQQVPLSLVQLQMGGNISVTLDYPSQNPLYSEYNQIPSQMSALVWIGFTWAMISVTYISGKLFIDIQYSGGIRIALPIVVLSFCYVGSVIITFFSLTSFAGVFSPAHIHASGFLILFPYTCSTSACVLMGFYFTETAHLTSMSRIALLDRLKIPGYIAIGLIWIVFFIVSGIGIFYRSGNPGDTAGTGPGYAIAVTYGILALFSVFIALFGGISLIRAAPEGPLRNKIYLTVGLVILAAFVNIAFLPIVITLRWWVFDAFASYLTERSILLLFNVCWVWPPAWVYLLLGSVFRVSVSKEIEISKSATSSTSSMSPSSSSSSSSSSDSGRDPVIEL
jgi:hypothetical protein